MDKTPVKHLCTVAGIAWTLAACLCVPHEIAAQYIPTDYYEYQQGSAPILIIASHGGTELLPGVGLRGCGPSVECDTDWNTALLAEEFADNLFLDLRQAPYYVISHASRTQVDLNRAESLAYDDPTAAPFYDAFHSQIQAFVDEIRTQWGAGLIIDIHGQSEVPDTIFRGTKDGLTVTQLIAAHGTELALGEVSLLGQLAMTTGGTVHPLVTLPPESQVEDPRYNGGYIVQTYGSHHATGLDAYQIEFGFDFRNSVATTRTTAGELADATAAFYELYSAPVVPVPEVPTACSGIVALVGLFIGRRRSLECFCLSKHSVPQRPEPPCHSSPPA